MLPKYHSQWRQIALAESSNKNCNITAGCQIEAIMRAYIMIMALPAFAMFALVNMARTQDRTYAGFNCTVDCSGHEAGYRWAEQNSIDDEDYCPDGDSESFHEGCIAYVRGEQLAANDDGVRAGMPLITDPDDDDDRK